MSPKTRQQFNEIRKNRKAAIEEAAMELFAKNGFSGVSISTIAAKAGISKGLLYNYFANKEALVKEIILEGIRQMMQKLDFDFEKEITESRFKELIEKNFALLQKEATYWSLYIAVITQPAVIALVKGEIFELVSPFITALTKYYQKKGVRYPETQSLLLGAVLDGVAIDFMLSPEEYPLDEIKALIMEKFI
jgi:AcrR family transcriptional regulator